MFRLWFHVTKAEGRGRLPLAAARLNQAIPCLLLCPHAVDPTEEGMALKVVAFGFILVDYLSGESFPRAGSPNSHPWHCVAYAGGSGEDDKGKATWWRGNREAGQGSLLLLCHLGCGLQHSTSLRHLWPCCSLLLRDKQQLQSNCLLAEEKTTQATPKILFSLEFPFF